MITDVILQLYVVSSLHQATQWLDSHSRESLGVECLCYSPHTQFSELDHVQYNGQLPLDWNTEQAVIHRHGDCNTV